MKKILLSAAIAAAMAAPAAAQDYVFYIGTEVENYAVSNYTEIKEGENYEVHPEFHDVMLHCAAYIKVTNNTTETATCNVDIEEVYDHNEFDGENVMWQTCLGMTCQTGNVSAIVGPESSTPGGTGEHIGYSYVCLDPSKAEGFKFDSKFNITMTMGDLVRHFSVTYTSENTGIDTIGQAAGEAEYFNLQGVRVNEPAKGELYIVRQGGKVSKTIVR